MKRRSRELSTFELTPLIDVVFLLLIFFMVSTVFKKDELALLLTLPKNSHGSDAKTNNMVIELNQREVSFNGKKTTLADLERILGGIRDKNTSLELRIDQDVKYNRVTTLLGLLKKHQLSNLLLITED